MIVYQKTKGAFLDDVLSNEIENIIYDSVKKNLNRNTGASEVNSWKNSLQYMNNILMDTEIPENIGVSIEYRIPQSMKRIDFILTGRDEENIEHAVLIELKQWSSVELTDKDGIVRTFMGRSLKDEPHPSYQAWSYAALLEGFNEAVYENNIQLRPCAYMHNYKEDGIVNNEFYADYISKAPLFLKSDAVKLRNFIKRFVKKGDDGEIMYRIEAGRIRPSKALADSVAGMLKQNQEFIMIDEQKVVFETAKALAKQSLETNKNVLIVHGGPGTGKSVVAINLLSNLMNIPMLVQYVSKNAAPRDVYESKLTGSMKKTRIANLFKGSGSYIDVEANFFDALIVDEAHRLNKHSGLFNNLGENQVKELINAAKFTVFFLDEYQQIHLKDIGSREEIIRWAELAGATVTEMELTSQFRCNGSDGFLAWVDNTLQIRETANEDLTGIDYDFKVFDDPNELFEAIYEKNKINNKARVVAGYCWDWKSKKDPNANDIVIEEHKFRKKWNLDKYGNLWLIEENSVNEIGCIHTCQGLEVDYIGVIIGGDLIIRDGKVITNPDKRSKMDQSIKGYKKLLEDDPINGRIVLDKIIKNTYRTLMTRGMKGCYVYFIDNETRKLLKSAHILK
ncbi:MAG: family ATPase [Chitinophagaceae bacterium]|nr:family ATPase [Chitinophagaceae bacterium]